MSDPSGPRTSLERVWALIDLRRWPEALATAQKLVTQDPGSAPSWLALTQGRPKPAPFWLRRWQWLYAAAIERFWLDRLGFTLLVKPTDSFAQDIRGLEEHFIDRALGEPGRGQPLNGEHPLIVGDGLAGRALAGLAERLQRLETHLSLRGRGGVAERLLLRISGYLRVIENLLEQPRYLMMAVMVTFVVIL